jgi:hypothetical protein
VTTTTALELLATADQHARSLITGGAPVTLGQWETFDDTLFRLLNTLVGPRQLGGHDPGTTRTLITTLQAYPQPIRPARFQTYSSNTAARLLDVPRSRITKRLREGDLTYRVVEHEPRIDAGQLDTRPDVTPASSTDPHPLAKLSVTLGGLADLLTHAGTDADGDGAAAGALTDDQHTAAVMRHVLALAAVTARHSVNHLPIADADRPLRIAQYAERAVDALAGHDASSQLWDVTSVHQQRNTDTVHDRLEAALEEWARAAQDDLRQRIPSSDVLQNIMTTGVHILATTDAALNQVGEKPQAAMNATAGLRQQLRTTALALHAAAAAWQPVTTAMTPSARYVTASREAFGALDSAQTILTSSPRGAAVCESERALRNLSFAIRPLSAHVITIDLLSTNCSTPACCSFRALAVRPRAETIRERATGRLVVARRDDVPTLVDRTHEARAHVAELGGSSAGHRAVRIPFRRGGPHHCRQWDLPMNPKGGPMVTRGPRSPWSGSNLVASQGVVVSEFIIRRRCQTVAEVTESSASKRRCGPARRRPASSPGGSPWFARVGSDSDKVTHDAVIAAALRRPRMGGPRTSTPRPSPRQRSPVGTKFGA